MSRLTGAGRSHVGLKRKNNEDSLFFDDEMGLYIVADGMGGAASGEVASRLVVEAIVDYLKANLDRPVDSTQRYDFYDRNLSARGNSLMQAVYLANRLVYDTAHQQEAHRGMGSTLAAIMSDGEHLLVTNVGDSRIFRQAQKGPLERLTIDHRFSDDPQLRGVINPEATIVSQMGNVLTRAMGIRENVIADLKSVAVRDGDIFLLCSDGLSDMVPEEMIAKVLAMSSDLEKKAGDLIQLALAGGGKDNVTVVLAEIQPVGGLKKFFSKIAR